MDTAELFPARWPENTLADAPARQIVPGAKNAKHNAGH